MAAQTKLSQLTFPHNSSVPRNGVLTLYGYGISVRVERGHLLIEDGIGEDRRHFRLARVGHGLKRLVVIGPDGSVSLSALRWITDQNASFIMLDREGSLLGTAGLNRSSDTKLRRAQALAIETGMALRVSRELIDRKLAGQSQVAKENLRNAEVAESITTVRSEIAEAESLDALRNVESQGARVYWSAWRTLTIPFPRKDLTRVPEHWLKFESRISPLTGSPRLASNPVNAMLNYLYALLESEARLATAAVGLDPTLGFIHFDTPNRDSLACDVMEAVRPYVDAYVLNWITQQPLKREWFFEERNGNCRLMADFAARLAETLPMWRRAVAPHAEWLCRTLLSNKPKAIRSIVTTPLTQQHRREAKGRAATVVINRVPKQERVCVDCGKTISSGSERCAPCAIVASKEHFAEAARKGRIASHTPEALAKEGATQRRHALARSNWNFMEHPSWLTETVYKDQIQPKLATMTNNIIAKTIQVSKWYAGVVRKGLRIPHPRHWLALARIAGVDNSISTNSLE